MVYQITEKGIVDICWPAFLGLDSPDLKTDAENDHPWRLTVASHPTSVKVCLQTSKMVLGLTRGNQKARWSTDAHVPILLLCWLVPTVHVPSYLEWFSGQFSAAVWIAPRMFRWNLICSAGMQYLVKFQRDGKHLKLPGCGLWCFDS